MLQRNVLPDCCEDWILQYGSYYTAGQTFRCLECSTEWQKVEPGRFRRLGDGRTFVRRVRVSEGSEFPYLAAADGHNPITERCCARILLEFGSSMKVDGFVCPVCGTRWTRELRSRGGIPVVCFQRPGLEEPLAIQKGHRRSFLVPLSSYRLPTE